jgi:phospholipid transport system transporter-binding protein
VSARIETSAAGEYRVSGELTFATASELLKASPAFDRDVVIDLAAMTAIDSAGLALLIEWYRTASHNNKGIRFSGVSAQLRALAKISEIDQLLAL